MTLSGIRPEEKEECLVVRYWIGCYTPAGRGGIGVLDEGDELTVMGGGAPTSDPSMLVTSPLFPNLLWAVDEGADAVVALLIGPDGLLQQHTRVPTAGIAPCHLSISADGRTLLAACYGDGAVSAHPLDAAGLPGAGVRLPHPGDFRAGPHPAQQDGSHAHSTLWVGVDLLVADLGTDRVHRYRREGDGFDHMESFVFPPGSGPRDLMVAPDGRVLTLGEHDCRIHVLDLQLGVVASTEVVLDPVLHDQAAGLALSRGSLTVGLRGSNRIAQLRFGGDGIPYPVRAVPSGGDWPRHHIADQHGLLVANERSGTIVRLPRQPDGSLGSPTAMALAPAVTYLLAAGSPPPAL